MTPNFRAKLAFGFRRETNKEKTQQKKPTRHSSTNAEFLNQQEMHLLLYFSVWLPDAAAEAPEGLDAAAAGKHFF